MWKTIFGVILAFIAIFFAGKYIVESNKRSLTKLPEVGSHIYLVTQSGDVYFKTPDSAQFIKSTSSPTAIANQTIIRTENGYASILLPSGSVISLATSTEVAVNYNASSTSIFQSIGQTYHRVHKLLIGETYNVQTPGTLAAVRGTKFAVYYNQSKKETKISVTESKVAVSKIKKEFDIRATSSQDLGIGAETILIEEGKTAKIALVPDRGRPSIEVINITEESERDFLEWIEKNRKEDPVFEERVNDESSEQTKERRLIEFLNEGIEEIDRTEANSSSEETIRKTPIRENTEERADEPAETSIEAPTESIPEERVETEIIRQETVPITTSVIRTLSEEEFFDKFIRLYEDNFYVDENDKACLVSRTGDERYRLVSEFASNNKRPISSVTLPEFAKKVEEYCKSGSDPQIKAGLQKRFDDEFPFQ